MNREIFHEMALKAKDGKPIVNVCLEEIEYLRQQLTNMTAERDMWSRAFKNGGTETMQKQVTLLRDAIEYSGVAKSCQELADALAATADLDGLILCHAEPLCHVADLVSPLVWKHVENGTSALTPLYSAWEPK